MSKTLLITLVVALESLTSFSFVINPVAQQGLLLTRSLDRLSEPSAFITRGDRVVLNPGFGSGGSKKKKQVKIKPKQQWDRYSGDLKKEKPYRVAVKAEGKDSDEWLEVGNVKSKGGAYTKAAVARQRALIAEVSYSIRSFDRQVVKLWKLALSIRLFTPNLTYSFCSSKACTTIISFASIN